MNLLTTLEGLLETTPDRLDQDCHEAWLGMAGSQRPPVVLFGAGRLGRNTRGILGSLGWDVLGFVDNDPLKWGIRLDGIPVLSPEEAASRFGPSACFVICIWRAEGGHCFQKTKSTLMELGVQRITHFGHLAWELHEHFLPYYSLDLPSRVVEARSSVLKALELMTDETSRETFTRQVLWRLTLDFNFLPDPDLREIYFPADLMPPVKGDVFIDGGAFDGDTAARFLELWGANAAAVHSFEPDPRNAQKFRAWLEAHPAPVPVHLHEHALGSAPGILRFCAEGSLSSAGSSSGEITVPCLTLDQIFEGGPIGLLKLDVEGAEVDILQGGARLLSRERPRLSICLYHRQAHVWQIPLLLAKLVPSYKFHLCSHGTEGWDLVLYASAK